MSLSEAGCEKGTPYWRYLFLSKPFKTIHEQLFILHKRGLIVRDYKHSKNYLLSNNYYSIINGYSKYFFKSTNVYLPGATFDEISSAYFFDKEIKYTFFKAILESEKHIKSILAYVFSEANHEKAYFYLDRRSYDTSRGMREINFVIRQMVKVLDKHKFKKNGNAISHYFKDHQDVPFWVLCDYLTFGDIVAIIRNLPISIQDKIAKKFYSFISSHQKIKTNFTPSIMLSFIENIAEVRNICAHDNRLYNFKCRNSLKYYKDLHQRYKISSSVSKSTTYHVFIALQCFLSKTEYAKLHNTLLARFKAFNNKLHVIDINVFLNSLGFPDNWHLSSKLPQM